MDMGLGELPELVMDRKAWRAVIHGVAKSRTWLSDWTELKVFPSSAAKSITNLISVLTIWWYSSVDGLLCCWKRVFAMTSVFFWQNCISLCPASFCTPSSNLPEISLHCFLSLHSNPLWWKEHLFWVSILEGTADFNRTVLHRSL